MYSQSSYCVHQFGNIAFERILITIFKLIAHNFLAFLVKLLFTGLLFFFHGDFIEGGKGDNVANGGKSSQSKDSHSSDHRVDQSWCLPSLSVMFFFPVNFCKSYIINFSFYVD